MTDELDFLFLISTYHLVQDVVIYNLYISKRRLPKNQGHPKRRHRVVLGAPQQLVAWW